MATAQLRHRRARAHLVENPWPYKTKNGRSDHKNLDVRWNSVLQVRMAVKFGGNRVTTGIPWLFGI